MASECPPVKSVFLVRKMALNLASLAATFAGLLAVTSPAAADRSLLWGTTKLCVFDQQVMDSPLPCESVDLARAFVVIQPDAKHVLLLPASRVEGIESPEVRSENAPNYFEYAWEVRSYLGKVAGKDLPRDDVGLAVNSAQGRPRISCTFTWDACVRM
jgi:CDP-diacylglycerol pyrophosphatase